MKHSTRSETLSNGIKLLLIDTQDTKTFDMVISIGAGYRIATKENIETYESPHLLEHMVFDGSSRYENADALQEVFNAGGGEWNGVTTAYTTQFMFHNRIRNAEQLIDAAFDAVFHPLLREQSFSEEIRVVENELNDYMTDFALNADQYTQQQVLPELPVSTDTQLMRLPSVSYAGILEFHKRYYTTANTKVVVLCDVSQLSRKKIMQRIEAATKHVPKGRSVNIPHFEVAKSEQTIAPVQIAKIASRSVLSLQFIIEGSADTKRMTLLNMFCAMANGLSSFSINYKLRKLGMTYGTAFSGLRSRETYGIEVLIDNENEKFNQVLVHTLALLRSFLNEGISDDQFKRFLKETIESVDDAETSTDGLMSWYVDDFLIDDSISSPDEYRAMLQTITKDDVFSLARSVITPEHQFGTIFTSRKIRSALAVIAATDAILKEGIEVNDEFIDGLSAMNGGFVSLVRAEWKKRQQVDATASQYRKLGAYISSHAWLAWSLNLVKAAAAIFLGTQAWDYFNQPDVFLGIVTVIGAVYLAADVIGEAYFRLTDKPKKHTL